MMSSLKSALLLLLPILMLSACATPVLLPPTATVIGKTSLDEKSAKAAWARVLARHVDTQGRVDFAAIAAAPQDLETWLAYVATVSPRSHPKRFANKQAQLAYYIDAYNALALYGVIRSGVLPAQNVHFFLLRTYAIGGEQMSLFTLENDVIRKFGDPRIHFALNCMAASCPRLPQQPWTSERLDQQLDAASREFFNTERHLYLDDQQKIVYVSEILDFFPADFLAVAPSLTAYINRYRQQPVPVEYRVYFIPYDWSLNAIPGTQTRFAAVEE